MLNRNANSDLDISDDLEIPLHMRNESSEEQNRLNRSSSFDDDRSRLEYDSNEVDRILLRDDESHSRKSKGKKDSNTETKKTDSGIEFKMYSQLGI